MDDKQHRLEDLFHDALEGHNERPSPSAWREIEKELDRQRVIRVHKKYIALKRSIILLGFFVSSAVLVNEYFTNYREWGSQIRNSTESTTLTDRHNEAQSAQNDLPVGSLLRSNGNFFIPAQPEQQNAMVSKDPFLADAVDSKQPVSGKSSSFSFQGSALTQAYSIEPVSGTSMNNSSEIVKSLHPKSVNVQRRTHSAQDYGEMSPQQSQALLTQNFVTSYSENRSKVNGNLQLLQVGQLTPGVHSPSLVLNQEKCEYPAQNALNSRQTKSIWSSFTLSAFFSPDLPWYRVQRNSASRSVVDELENEERHEFSSTFGVVIDRKFGGHWGGRTGVTFSNTNLTLEPKVLYAQPDESGTVKFRIDTKSGYGYVLPAYSTNPRVGDSLYSFSSMHSLQYIGIPLAIQYGIQTHRFKVRVMAGIMLNILTRARLETTIIEGFHNSMESVDKLRGLKKGYLAGLAGAEIGFALNQKIELTFSPLLHLALNSINKDGPISSYPNAIGLATGIKFGF